MVLECCDNCHFYGRGECHKSPPVRLPRRFDVNATESNRIRNESLLWGWPKVPVTEWCGAYQAISEK
jgi:hypothetical protein